MIMSLLSFEVETIYKRSLTMETKKPEVKLVGEDGNAFVILGRCCRAGRKAGWNDEQVDTFLAEAKKGDYDHLLQTVTKYFDVE
jgi:hypothetical protein